MQEIHKNPLVRRERKDERGVNALGRGPGAFLLFGAGHGLCMGAVRRNGAKVRYS